VRAQTLFASEVADLAEVLEQPRFAPVLLKNRRFQKNVEKGRFLWAGS
jgi:hypothetical protein